MANKSCTAKEVQCTFRVTGKQPELWWPESGRIEQAAVYHECSGITFLPLRLEATESVFVVFRPLPSKPAATQFDQVVTLSRDGRPFDSQPLPTLEKKHVIVINKATYGLLGDLKPARQVREKLQALIDRDGASLLVSKLSIGDDPAPGVEKTLEADYTIDGRPHHAGGQDHETLDLLETLPDDYAAERVAEVHFAADGKLRLTAWKSGQYELKTSSRRTFHCRVESVPEPQEIAGPWELKFPPGGGAPKRHLAEIGFLERA